MYHFLNHIYTTYHYYIFTSIIGNPRINSNNNINNNSTNYNNNNNNNSNNNNNNNNNKIIKNCNNILFC